MSEAPSRFTSDDARALARAVEFAALGRGEVEPNPCVGALLVRVGETLAEGWHAAFGEAHAEAVALRAFEGGVSADATLVVTLEPCSSEGPGKKRPPCVDLLLRTGVRRVVVGEIDPDPRHAGRGLELLRRAGVEVVVAPAGSVPPELLAPFRRHLGRDRPWVMLKWAQTRDGRWSVPGSRYLSCEESLREVHRLRAHCDGLLVGSGTVLADDPRLTARPPGERPLVRIVVDGRGRLPAGAQVFRDGGSVDGSAPTWWITGREVVHAPPPGVLHVKLARPHDVAGELLPALAHRGIRRLLVEGGPTVARAFLDAEVVDQARACVVSFDHADPTFALQPPVLHFQVHEARMQGVDLWLNSFSLS